MQDKRIQQGLEWLMKEVERDNLEIKTTKNQMIEEIKKIDKTKMFTSKEKKKIGFWKKILIIFGYGKKG